MKRRYLRECVGNENTPILASMGTLVLRLKRPWTATFLVAAFLGLICQIGAATCTPSPNGLIGWWSGDGNANDLVAANNGSLQGGASAGAVGIDGFAFNFDGTNSYVQIPDSPSLRPTNLTVEAWVRFSSLDSVGSGGSPPGDQYIIFKQNTKSSDFEGFDLGKTRIAGNDYFQFIVSSPLGQVAHLESATIVSAGVWYHVAAVRDPNFIRLFINGQLEGEANVTFPQDYGTFPLFFGTSGQSYWDRKFSGTLDEVSLYNRALSAGEITAIYSAGTAGKCKGATVLAQPQSQSIVFGESALFSVSAAGLAPLRYQWQFNGANIANASNSTLALSNVQVSNAGNYTAVVTNALGTSTSAPALLTVLVPPTITAQPQSRTNVAGTIATFSASASGSAPFSYQWQFNSGNISGATDATLTLNNVQPTDAGSYRVVVTNSAGSVTSAVASLTVWLPPSITAQPQSRTNVLGSTATFGVAATGTAPLSYQWQFNGVNIAAATATNLTIGSVQASDAGNYSVVVTNPAASAISAVAVLTVWVLPAISLQPQSRTNVIGTTAGFTVSASGTPPLSYQWQFNGANIGGATGSSFTVANVQTSDAGSYSVVVTNVAGSATSGVAALTVLVPPSITTQPQSRTNVVGTTATFNGAASGTAPLSYQWQFNGANLPGATGTSLTLNNVQGTDAGNYALVITNAGGSVTSAAAVLTVWVPPSIASQPQSRTNVSGTTAAFSVVANGTPPLSYQWQFNGANIGGATGATFTLGNVQAGDAGNYTVVVTNSAGSVTSVVAILTVLVPPSITTQPLSRTNVVGTAATFSSSASGTTPLSYQWQFNGANIAGATGTSLTLNTVQPGDAGNYAMVVTNSGGSITSAVAVLTVWVPPGITSQPQNRTNVLGTSAVFSVVAAGTAPFSYQWQFSGANIVGATGATFTIPSVQSSDAGGYAVVVTNSAGSATSDVAVLTVWVPPAITSQPQSRTNVLGTSAGFRVTASGTAPLSYQWQFDGASVSGATGSALTLNNVQAGDAGNYTVVVTNSAGSTTSAVAVLTVWVPPSIASQPQSRTNVVGTSASFNVAASGTVPLNYQWQRDGENIPGAVGPSLLLSNVQSSDAANYSVVVTNVAGSVTSTFATLTVWTPPSISGQPQGRTNILGTTAVFAVSATGTSPLAYEWQFNGGNISGAIGTSIMLNNVQPNDAGAYSVVVTNSAGAVTSALATLTVLLPPTFAVQPRSHTNVAFVTAAFSAAASGTPPFTYQWQFNGLSIAGASGPSLKLNNPQVGDSGNYTLVVTNSAGVATSAVANLTVIPPTDCISAPQGLVGWWPGEGNANDIAGTNNGVLQGGAVASAAGVVSSSLGFDGANGFVQIPDVTALKPANLSVICWVRFDSLDSAGNTPSLGQQFVIFKQNSRASSFEGFLLSKERVTGGDVFSWTVTSATGQSVRLDSTETIVPGVWYHVGAVRGPDFIRLYVNGQLEAVTNVTFPQDYGNLPLYFGSSGQPSFDRKLSGALDEVGFFNRALGASEIAADYFAGTTGKCKAPKFLSQPADLSGYWGGSATFASTATGVLPLKYQWRKNGLPLPSATNSFLLLSNLQSTDAGNYALQATNSFGTANSDSAQLKVYVADVVIGQSTNAGLQSVAALSISGVTGQLYGIQVSPSLGPSNHWTGLTNITLPAPSMAWFDPQSATQAQRFYRIVPGPIAVSEGTWETSEIGVVWSDDFNRSALGSNWVVLGSANVNILNNELQFAQFNTDYSRQVYYQPWLISSDEWTIRWTQRFGALDSVSYGVGVGIKNFQAAGGNDRGYNGLLLGTGPGLGQMQISRFDGAAQQPAAVAANAISIAAGDTIDCSLTRSGWTMTATASNRANAQVSTSTLVYSESSNLIAPTISRVCFYPLGGTVYLDNISFKINHRKPARFIVIGASASDGYNASIAARRYVSVVQSNFFEAVCNDSSSYNTTTNAIATLPEILAHRPATAILMIGGNDLAFGYPASQWQTQYSNLVAQLQAKGVAVKHTFQTPRNGVDLTPLRNWIIAHYPAADIIDTWTPFVTNAFSLKPIYDSGDGVHPNDAGHLLLGQIIRTNLP
jgi:lysophospholipase L1-like esterase